MNIINNFDFRDVLVMKNLGLKSQRVCIKNQRQKAYAKMHLTISQTHFDEKLTFPFEALIV